MLLVPELLTRPLRENATDELDELSTLLGRLDLLPADVATAELATALGAAYRLRAPDAIHLATAGPRTAFVDAISWDWAQDEQPHPG